MESKTKILGHPAHQILVVFPLGLLATSLVFDAISLITRKPKSGEQAQAMVGAGLVGGLAAAPWGMIDWLAIPERTRAKEIGRWHGVGNVIVLSLFGASWLTRRNAPEKLGGSPFLLSLLGGGLAMLTAWLGGELVDRLGVGVDDGAHLNAPSSLSGLPASDTSLE